MVSAKRANIYAKRLLSGCFWHLLQSVTLHTDVGDVKIELFCEDCPKTCENFLALCASDYYNGSLFHRNIKGFIVQTGDPTGTGKGGNSIWERKFEDEFKDNLKHTDRGMVSMANSGPNSNQSQFFFTYAAQPHLDLKYTLFGRLFCLLLLNLIVLHSDMNKSALNTMHPTS